MARTLGGVALDDPAGRWTLNSDSRVRMPPPVVVNDVALPGRHGVLPGLPVAGPGGSVLAFDLVASGYDQLLANHHALLAFCGPRPGLRTLVDGDYRALVQYVSATELEVVAGDTNARVAVTFSIPSGFWQDAATTTVDLGGTDGTKTPAALQGGTAPIVDPVFVVEGGGAGTDITITDTLTGTWVRWNGDAPDGQSVRFNPHTATAKLASNSDPWSGDSDTANVQGYLTIGPGQFQLSPDVSFTVTHAGSRPVQVRARRAYL